MSWGDDDPLGALDDRERPTHDDFFSFADLEVRWCPALGLRYVEDEPADAPDPVAAWDDDDELGDAGDDYEDPPTRRVATGQRVGRAAAAATYRARRIPRVGGGGGGGGGAPGGPGGMDRDLGQAAIVGGEFLAGPHPVQDGAAGRRCR